MGLTIIYDLFQSVFIAYMLYKHIAKQTQDKHKRSELGRRLYFRIMIALCFTFIADAIGFMFFTRGETMTSGSFKDDALTSALKFCAVGFMGWHYALITITFILLKRWFAEAVATPFGSVKPIQPLDVMNAIIKQRQYGDSQSTFSTSSSMMGG